MDKERLECIRELVELRELQASRTVPSDSYGHGIVRGIQLSINKIKNG